MKKIIASLCLIAGSSAFSATPAIANSCPANIGEYGYHDGRGGSFGETLMALEGQRPHCICKLNKQWIKEWYDGFDGKVGDGFGDADARQYYADWLKECKR